MGGCYGKHLEEYKHKYPMSTKLESNDPRLTDPNFLKEEIHKLDYIIKHQNNELSKLDDENEKLRKKPRNQKKVLNNAKKLYLMTKNGFICKWCLETHDNNLIPAEQLVDVEGLCGHCKGNGLQKEHKKVKSKQCGICDRYFEYLWAVDLCKKCNGVGMLQNYRNSHYAAQMVDPNDRPLLQANPYQTSEDNKGKEYVKRT